MSESVLSERFFFFFSFFRHLCFASLGGSCVEGDRNESSGFLCPSVLPSIIPSFFFSPPRTEIDLVADKGGADQIGNWKGVAFFGLSTPPRASKKAKRERHGPSEARAKREAMQPLSLLKTKRISFHSPAAPCQCLRGPPLCTPWSRTGSSPQTSGSGGS